jgi:transcriptional regulator with XRE-family HTH domain
VEEKDDFEFLGPALVVLRKRDRKSARAVAKEMERSPAVISRYEQGGRDISSRDLLRYLKVVGASLAELHLALKVLKMLRSGPESEPERDELQFVMKVLRVLKSGTRPEPEVINELTSEVDSGSSTKTEDP